ncbi:hypothetical protein CNMCM6936_000148 [Aspergillus lentulus]|nr:hypothetical protein CNMCM6069_006353 [Aspergillus lentulus]KAF4163924.1 hypothetical protein CNMCM6936_000148 [Aspergillus lentulus]KAF4176157.1 hypothetical protein CNMCM8060_006574 [Aspergillus lentulus]KAF4181648.1 hypothetical protein CNMCM7927_000527 [Aspergillus lentulus]KAF4192694.1 hypothetical protein CNMCM8694_000094 [Aspergillus lentulus]
MCANYTDFCAAIESEFCITFAQFYSWNPGIGTTTPASSTSTTGAVPTETGISTCKTYYTAVEGYSCWSIEQAYVIRADDFVSWNPAVGEDCSGLWLGYSYCVGV